MSFGERLAELIKNKGVTPYEIFIKTGVSQSTISRVLNNNTTKPGIRNIEILAEYFNVDSDWLRTGSGNRDLNINQTTDNSTINSKLSYEMTEELIKEMLKIISKQQDDIHLANQTIQLANQNLMQAQNNQAALINKVTDSNIVETGGSFQSKKEGDGMAS